MRPFACLALAAVVAAAAPILSACDSLNSFEIFDTKKKLPGERREVFPDGVPGVTSGVPAELVKGYHEPENGGLDPAKAAAEAAAEPAAKPKKPKPAPQRTASKPASKKTDPYASAPAGAAQAQQPAPQAATTPWPSAQPQAAWPGSR